MTAIESNTVQPTSTASAAPVEADQLYFTTVQSVLVLPGSQQCCPLPNVAQLGQSEAQPQANFTNVFSAITALLTKITELISKLAEAVKAAQPKPAESAQTSTPATSPSTSGSSTPSTATAPTEAPIDTSAKLTFAEKEKSVLKPDSNDKVSELELRRGVIVYQLYQKDAKLADEFQSAYDKALAGGATPTSAVKSALQQIVDEKKLSKGDANWVYSLSAKAAQFEGSQDALSTSTTGSHGLDGSAAIRLAEQTLAGIQSGAVKVKPLTI